MPKNVRRFGWLWCAYWVICAACIPLVRLPVPPALKLGRLFEMGLVAGGFAIQLAVFLPFFWLAVLGRKNWAKWVLFVPFVASMPFIFVGPASIYHQSPGMNAIGLLSALTLGAGFYFLFTGDARPWFKRESFSRKAIKVSEAKERVD